MIEYFFKSGQETITRDFESKAWLVKWNDLRTTLYLMERVDVIDHIEKSFLYTKGKNNYFFHL